MPRLENLQLAGNQIKVLGGGDEAQGPVRGFKNLKWLNLEENELEVWEEIAKLRELERYFLFLKLENCVRVCACVD